MCPIIKSTQTSSSHKVKHLPTAVIYRTSIFTERFGKGGQGKSPLSLARLLTEVYAISWYQSGDDMGGVDTGKRQQENSPLINNLTLVIHELGRFSKVTFSSWARVGDGGEGNGDWEVENLSSTPIAYRSLGAHADDSFLSLPCWGPGGPLAHDLRWPQLQCRVPLVLGEQSWSLCSLELWHNAPAPLLIYEERSWPVSCPLDFSGTNLSSTTPPNH